MKADAEQWVLLRGLTREATHWGSFPSLLQKTLANAKVTTIDLAGTGREHKRVSPFSTAAIAADVLSRLERTAKGARYVIGISFGGLVALEMARQNPALFSGAVLINSSLGRLNPIFQRLQPAGIQALARALWTRDAITRETMIYRITCNKAERERDTVAKWAQVALLSPVTKRTLIAQLSAAARYDPQTVPKSMRFLVCLSEKDRLVHPSCSERLARWLKAPCERHPTAGHDLAHDDPDWLAKKIAHWRDEIMPLDEQPSNKP